MPRVSRGFFCFGSWEKCVYFRNSLIILSTSAIKSTIALPSTVRICWDAFAFSMAFGISSFITFWSPFFDNADAPRPHFVATHSFVTFSPTSFLPQNILTACRILSCRVTPAWNDFFRFRFTTGRVANWETAINRKSIFCSMDSSLCSRF